MWLHCAPKARLLRWRSDGFERRGRIKAVWILVEGSTRQSKQYGEAKIFFKEDKFHSKAMEEIVVVGNVRSSMRKGMIEVEEAVKWDK